MPDGFRTLIEFNADAIIIIGNDGVIRFVNPASEVLFGRSKKDLVGSLLGFPLSLNQPEEVDILQSDGRLRVAEMRMVKVEWEGEEVCLATLRDITSRKLLEQKEKRHRIFLETLLETIPIPVFYKDLQGRYLGCNRAFEEFQGKGRDEILGKKVHEIAPQELADKYHEKDVELFQNLSEQVYEWHVKAADGSLHEVIFNKAIFYDENAEKAGIIGTISDITNYQRAQDALRRSEERFTLAMEATKDGLWDWNVLTGATYFSPSCFTMLGYEPNELSTNYETWLDLLHPDDIKAAVLIYSDCIENKRNGFENEVRLKAKNGDYRWILCRGKVIQRNPQGRAVRLVGTNIDISAYKKLEDKLSAERNRLYNLLDIIPGFIYLQDSDYTIKFANRYFVELFGDNLEKKCYQIIQGRQAPCEECPTFRVFDTNKPQLWEWHSEDKIFQIFDYPFTENDGSSLVLEMGIDISEIKHLESKLKISLREKEVLLKEIHHRVKNNLQIISGLLTMQSRMIDNEQIKDMFRDCHSRIRSMALVHEVLYRSGNLSDIKLDEYLQTLIKEMVRSYRKDGQAIQIRTDISNITIKIDTAIPCGLIISELVSNALKHAFSGIRDGELYISVTILKDNEIALLVRDNGVGIPIDFDLTNSNSLGLRLVTDLAVHQLKGKIIVKRENGTEFQINFKKAQY